MAIVRSVLDAFWNPHVWLPPNVTWADLEPTNEIQRADYRDLVYPFPFTIVMLSLRLLLER